MKKYLLAAVAALALGGVAKAADFTCHLIDQKGNPLDDTASVGGYKNGVVRGHTLPILARERRGK
jgi:hypothetical protein